MHGYTDNGYLLCACMVRLIGN